MADTPSIGAALFEKLFSRIRFDSDEGGGGGGDDDGNEGGNDGGYNPEAALEELVTSRSSYNEVKAALEGDPENAELKTKLTSAEEGFKSAELNYSKQFESKGDYPDDWRERYIDTRKDLDDDGKEKLLNRLKRYTAPTAAIDAMINAQNKISSGGLVVPKPEEGASEEEWAEYRQANGIPEKPEDYDIKLADGLVIGEEDKPIIDGFLNRAHEISMPQEQVSGVLNWYYGNQEEIVEQRHAADEKFYEEAQEELRGEWGADFKANTHAVENFFADAPEGLYDSIRFARTTDGTPLGIMPDAMRFFASKARAMNPASTLVPGTGEKQLEAMETEIAALEKDMGTEEWYSDEKKQKRYMQLISARDRLKAA